MLALLSADLAAVCPNWLPQKIRSAAVGLLAHPVLPSSRIPFSFWLSLGRATATNRSTKYPMAFPSIAVESFFYPPTPPTSGNCGRTLSSQARTRKYISTRTRARRSCEVPLCQTCGQRSATDARRASAYGVAGFHRLFLTLPHRDHIIVVRPPLAPIVKPSPEHATQAVARTSLTVGAT